MTPVAPWLRHGTASTPVPDEGGPVLPLPTVPTPPEPKPVPPEPKPAPLPDLDTPLTPQFVVGADMGLMAAVGEEVLSRLEARSRSARFFNDPVGWCEYMVGMRLWSKQAQVAQSVVGNRNTAVKAGHGVGKSQLAALLICWWVDTRYPDVFVASTAPSRPQISGIIWRYIRLVKTTVRARFEQGLIDHDLPGYVTASDMWKEGDGLILGVGRKPPDNKEDTFQGIHARYVLAVGDEAVGLPGFLTESLGNITTNETSRQLLICNPTNPQTHIGRLFRDKSPTWTFHTISVFDSPNFTDERLDYPREVLEKFVGQSYVDDMVSEYGEDSPQYISRVTGEFSYDLGDVVISSDLVYQAYNVEVDPPEDAEEVLGVDVARYGRDLTVVYSCRGGVLRLVDSWQGTSVVATAQRVHTIATERNVAEVRIDGSGIGGGVVDILKGEERFAEGTYSIVSLNSSGRTPDRSQWHNARAWWWSQVRDRLRRKELNLDPSDDKLLAEITAMPYSYNSTSGGLVLKSKDKIRKDGGKSPDFADAAVYACADLSWVSDMPEQGTGRGVVFDNAYDVFGDIPDFLRPIGGEVW